MKSVRKPNSHPLFATRRPWLPYFGLVALVFAAYSPATRCGFVWDDAYHVTNNSTLHRGRACGGSGSSATRRRSIIRWSTRRFGSSIIYGVTIPRVPRGQPAAARRGNDPVLASAGAAARARDLVRGRAIRRSSGGGRIGRLDHGTQERLGGSLRIVVAARVPAISPGGRRAR